MNNILLEYIWIGGNRELRSKVKVFRSSKNDISIDDLPLWNYDGSSTNQATTNDSEVILRPVRLYRNPFSDGIGFFVLCDTWVHKDGDLISHKTNTRIKAEKIFENEDKEDPLFGIEYEFFVKSKGVPLGYNGNMTSPQGKYYCSVGYGNSFGREILELATKFCLIAQINVTGFNLEVAPGQMEIQICEKGLKAGDDCIILKYILSRIGESNGLEIDWSSKPLSGDWNGSGCHVNFSTKEMREEGGWDHILKAIKKLKDNHMDHMKVYGDDNKLRLTGKHETSNYNEFSFGVASRSSSIRIPRETEKYKKGYFEDRRPSSSADMYQVTSKIYETCTN